MANIYLKGCGKVYIALLILSVCIIIGFAIYSACGNINWKRYSQKRPYIWRIPRSRKTDTRKKFDLLALQKKISGAAGNIVKQNGNHLFGLKTVNKATKISLSEFTDILAADSKTITVESSITIKAVLDYLIPRGYILQVTPDMSHLTIGGIIAGIGGGSCSFRYGYFHEIMTQFNIIIGNGELLTCTPTQNADLFYGVPNTLGTLGYITQITLKTRKCAPYIRTQNLHYEDMTSFFRALEKYQADAATDFLDGTIFGKTTFVLVVGQFRDTLDGKLDNFINDKVYWKAIQTDKVHWFKTIDYIYRWDTDMYYTSMIIPEWMNIRSIRRCIPPNLIPFIKKILPFLGIDNDIKDIVSDVLIPFSKMREFYSWYDREIGLYPVYICPAQSKGGFSFWKEDLLCDFGIAYGIETSNAAQKREKIEQKMLRLGGRKFLYSRTRMNQSDFWSIYDRDEYMSLRKKYHAKSPQWFDKITY